MNPGRPPKPAAARKALDLRIPVNAVQKQFVADAVRTIHSQDMASWARPILLREANRLLNPNDPPADPSPEVLAERERIASRLAEEARRWLDHPNATEAVIFAGTMLELLAGVIRDGEF